MRAERGFTLIELLVVLVLLGIVGGIVTDLMLRQQRVAAESIERLGLQSRLRTGVVLLTTELHEATGASAGGDLLQLAPDSITYRAMRAFGIVCDVTPSRLLLREVPFHGVRRPQAGRDSILLFVEGDSSIATDDRWLPLPVTGTGSGTGCGGQAVLSLDTVLDTALVPLSAIHLETAARIFEIMQVRLYQSGGLFWLGARSVSAGETIQPVLGPLTGTGLALQYFDSAGGPTTVPAAVRTIEIGLRARSEHLVRSAAGAAPAALLQDSVLVRIGLRNAPPF
ncbi:MAG: prepilin-type N-terminal cleavage/methylation domain-containing protein [Gemmatimonadota bacterium]